VEIYPGSGPTITLILTIAQEEDPFPNPAQWTIVDPPPPPDVEKKKKRANWFEVDHEDEHESISDDTSSLLKGNESKVTSTNESPPKGSKNDSTQPTITPAAYVKVSGPEAEEKQSATVNIERSDSVRSLTLTTVIDH
jgi:hypothetical protein